MVRGEVRFRGNRRGYAPVVVDVAYAIVVALSLLIGGGVYLATLRGGDELPAAVGFEDPDAAETVEGPGPGYTYLRVAVRGPSWRDRLQGFIGLIILLFFATAALAYGFYQLGHVLNLTIARFFDQ
jgi:hypothetical protein